MSFKIESFRQYLLKLKLLGYVDNINIKGFILRSSDGKHIIVADDTDFIEIKCTDDFKIFLHSSRDDLYFIEGNKQKMLNSDYVSTKVFQNMNIDTVDIKSGWSERFVLGDKKYQYFEISRLGTNSQLVLKISYDVDISKFVFSFSYFRIVFLNEKLKGINLSEVVDLGLKRCESNDKE